MSTYIKGVTDTLPGPTAMSPNYTLLQGTLSTLQKKYDRGFDQVKTMYNSLINSQLSSTDNEQFRSEYLKKADTALAQLSGVDLSNPNNVMKATSLFNPLVNDAQYSRDLYLTKTQDSEIGKMMQVKNSTDEKIRSQYDPKMEEWLMLGKQRLSQMKRDDGSIEKATSHTFSPWEDPVLYAMDLAKKQNLNITRETIEGLYRKKVTNGEQAYSPYKTWFNNVIGDRFDNQFRIEGELEHERGLRSLMASDKTLTRESATQMLAQNFSTQYVKHYNEQIDDMQAEIDSANLTLRKMQSTYKGGLTKQQYDYVLQLKEQRDKYTDALNKYKLEKKDDGSLQQKAIELYMGNPAGVRMGSIKDAYAKAFAYNQAYTVDNKVELTPDSAAMQLQQQSYDWSKMLTQQKFELEKQGRQQEFELMKAQLTGEIKGGTGSAVPTLTQPTNVGEIGLDQAYINTIEDLNNKSITPYLNTTVLGMAAAAVKINNGVVTLPANATYDLVKVRAAIQKKASGQALNSVDVANLKDYLNTVSPGSNYNERNSIGDIMAIVDAGVRSHKGLYPNLSTQVQTELDIAAASRQQNVQLYAQTNKHLRGKLTNPELAPYIVKTATGILAIDFAAVNKLDPEEKNYVLSKLVPDNPLYKSQTNRSMPGILLKASDPAKFDSSIFGNAIRNAEKVGVTDGTGKTTFYDSEQTAEFVNKVVGTSNMKEVFETDVEMHPKFINGQWYMQTILPVKRSTKGESLATSMGFDLTGDIAKQNKIELYVPMNKAMALAGNEVVYTNPTTGAKSILPNNIRDEIKNIVSSVSDSQTTSWVSEYGFSNPNVRESLFPSWLDSKIQGGKISAVNDNITLTFITNDGTPQYVDLTSRKGISYSMYQSDIPKYDAQILKYVTEVVNAYDVANTSAAQTKITNNRLQGDLIPFPKLD